MPDPRFHSKPPTRIVTPTATPEDTQFDSSLRPRRLDDFTGQPKVKEILSIAIESAKRRGDAMDHVLLIGPPGLGKTTLANIIAQELGVQCGQTSGPMLQKKLDLTGIMTKMENRQVFFIDEIHRLLPDVEEALYSVIEDFRIDVVVGAGTSAQTHSIPIQRFTIIGATTRQGLISAPLRSRFGLVLYLKPYDVAELTRIVVRAARLLEAGRCRLQGEKMPQHGCEPPTQEGCEENKDGDKPVFLNNPYKRPVMFLRGHEYKTQTCHEQDKEQLQAG